MVLLNGHLRRMVVKKAESGKRAGMFLVHKIIY